MSKKKLIKKKASPKVREKDLSSYQGAKQSAYGGEKTICKNAKCKLRKASCVGFIACPGFKS